MTPGHNDWRHYFHEAMKSPLVVFALAFALVTAVGAPLFALSDVVR
jgi:hypothetical protein